MRILKFFLYTIFFISLIWATLLFAGPPVLKSLIHSYSDGKITAHNIRVTPQLNIQISRLDYTLEASGGTTPDRAFFRSIEVAWSLLPEEPFLEFKIGPSFVSNTFSSAGATITTPHFLNINFQDLLLNIEMQNVKMISYGDIDSLTIEAFLNGKRGILKNVSVYFPYAYFYNSLEFSAAMVNAKVNQIDLTVPLDKQSFEINLSAGELVQSEAGVFFINPGLVLTHRNQYLDFQLTAATIALPKLGGNLGALVAEGSFDKKGVMKNADIKLADSSIYNGSYEAYTVSVDISNMDPDIFDINTVINLKPFEVKIADNYLGSVPAKSLTVDIRLNFLRSQIKAFSKFLMDSPALTKITGDGEMKINFKKAGNVNYDNHLLVCILTKCGVNALDFEFLVMADGQWISGQSSCQLGKCQLGSFSHAFQTSNTSEIFKKINASGVLNPVYAIYLYSLITSGKKVAEGHEIKIN